MAFKEKVSKFKQGCPDIRLAAAVAAGLRPGCGREGSATVPYLIGLRCSLIMIGRGQFMRRSCQCGLGNSVQSFTQHFPDMRLAAANLCN
jgi:hypothetical protein